MLHGVERQIDAGHRVDLAGPEAAGVDHVLGADGALLGHHVPAPVVARHQLDDPVAQVDLGPLQARRLGVGVGGAGGVQVAVEGVPEGAQHALRVDDGRARRDLRGADDLGLQAHVAVLGPLGLQLVQALGRVGEGQAADVVQAAGLAADLLQLLVEADGVALERGHVGVGVQGVEAARRVPGRARGQLVALDQDDVAPAELGQVIEHAAADDAAADDGHLDMGFHRCASAKCLANMPSAGAAVAATAKDARIRAHSRPPSNRAHSVVADALVRARPWPTIFTQYIVVVIGEISIY